MDVLKVLSTFTFCNACRNNVVDLVELKTSVIISSVSSVFHVGTVSHMWYL